jgi:hypothetical protein
MAMRAWHVACCRNCNVHEARSREVAVKEQGSEGHFSVEVTFEFDLGG